jgi:hypothetical protein
MTVSLSDEKVKKLISLLKKSFPEGSTNGVVEIYSLDDYEEYPILYRSSSGKIVTPVFNGWDSPESIAGDNLTRYLSDEISILKDNLDKKDPDYWNHFMFSLSQDGTYDMKFSYMPDIDQIYENKFRESIGDELYEKLESERNINGTSDNGDNIALEKQTSTDEKQEIMTVNELLSFILHEVIVDLPDDWEAVNIDAKVFQENGKQAISMKNEFKKNNTSKWHEFSTSNVFGPMNAILEIHKIMTLQGDDWSTLKISFFSDGKIKLETK